MQKNWKTAVGNFTTVGKTKIQFKLPELSESRIIEHTVHLTTTESKYDMIISRDILQALGLNSNFKEMAIEWDDVSVPMKSIDCNLPKVFAIEESLVLNEATERMKRILDAKYEPANLEELMKTNCSHLRKEE